MNTMKKLLALALTLVTVLTIAVGCTPPEIDDPNRFDEDPDKERTQLYVGYYNGGAGMTWLKKVKEEFEKLYPQYQIMIDPDKDAYQHDMLQTGMPTSRQDMYIGAEFDYYKFIEKGLLADISEATKTPLTEFGEDKSIADKMNASLKAYYKADNDTYYAVPYMEAYHHIVYDMDLFDEYNLWFKDGGGFVSSPSDKKSAGHDGEYGTWDDGLPVTYSEFFKMMDAMVARGITPLTWSGQYADAYLPNFIKSVISDYEGEQNLVNWGYNGSIDIITNKNFEESEVKKFELKDSDVETVTVTPENFDQYMYRTAGKYYALKWAKDLSSNSKYVTYNFAESHTGVQRSYLMSSVLGKPIAMMIEGNWWMNESATVFEEMAQIDSMYSMENRRFGIMPIPKADDGSSAEGHTMSPFTGNQAVMINNASTKKDIATLFFRFLHTDVAMNLFTQYSGIMKPFDYDTSEIIDSLHVYTQAAIKMRERGTYIYRVAINDKYKKNPNALSFMQYSGVLDTTIGEASSSNPIMFFCDNDRYTAKDYFLGLEYVYATRIPAGMK